MKAFGLRSLHKATCYDSFAFVERAAAALLASNAASRGDKDRQIDTALECSLSSFRSHTCKPA